EAILGREVMKQPALAHPGLGRDRFERQVGDALSHDHRLRRIEHLFSQHSPPCFPSNPSGRTIPSGRSESTCHASRATIPRSSTRTRSKEPIFLKPSVARDRPSLRMKVEKSHNQAAALTCTSAWATMCQAARSVAITPEGYSMTRLYGRWKSSDT